MKRVGRSNKPSINKAAQAVGKNCQNILDAGAFNFQVKKLLAKFRNTQEWMQDNLYLQLPGGGVLYQ